MAKRRTADVGNSFTGPLVEPILKPSPLATALTTGLYEDAVVQAVIDDACNEQKVEKLLLLAERFGIQRDTATRDGWSWLLVCMRLAEECVPGFRVLDRPLPKQGRQPGKRTYHSARKGTSVVIDGLELWQAILIHRQQHEKCSVAEACRALAADRKGVWRGSSAETLEARFYEFARRLKYLKCSQETNPLHKALLAAAHRARQCQ